MAYEKRNLTTLSDERLAEPDNWPESWDSHRVEQEWQRRNLEIQRTTAHWQRRAAIWTGLAALGAMLSAFASLVGIWVG